jgi:hypothetical protein
LSRKDWKVLLSGGSTIAVVDPDNAGLATPVATIVTGVAQFTLEGAV